MSDDDKLAEVVQLRPQSDMPEMPMTLVNGAARCKHNTVEVDAKASTVTCTACKQLVAPFDCLVEMAARHVDIVVRWERAKTAVQAAERGVLTMTKRIAALEDEEKRLRDRCSRLRSEGNKKGGLSLDLVDAARSLLAQLEAHLRELPLEERARFSEPYAELRLAIAAVVAPREARYERSMIAARRGS